ncbi:MAG TPA: DNA repair protein RecO [Vicinamibacterales bacterium]|nr:DNA repair protein RecO [Vicinamibacterales bacterium]
MPVYRSEALVLRTYKLGEADRIVVFLTRDRGKKRGVAQGARRPRSRFVGALEPLTRGEIAYYERENRELVRINYMEPSRSPLSLGPACDATALSCVGYFAELIDEWAQEADPNETLYRLGASALDALAAGAPVEALARYFEYWLLRLQGVYPSLQACPDCGKSLEHGAAVVLRDRVMLCRRCASAHPGASAALSADAVGFLRAARRLTPEGVVTAALPVRAARELELAHRRLIASHLDKELKSARVLRELR